MLLSVISRLALVSVVALMLLAVGCAKPDPQPGFCSFGVSEQLCATRWELRSLDDTAIQPGTAERPGISLLLDCGQGTANGVGICNRYNGSFSQSAGQELRFGVLSITEAHCGEPGSQIEQRYFEALRQTVRLEVQNQTLRLYDGSTATARLVFVAR